MWAEFPWTTADDGQTFLRLPEARCMDSGENQEHL